MTTGDRPQSPAAETLADQFRQTRAREVFRLALEVANEVIGFDAHRIYLAFRDKSELIWRYQDDYAGPPELEAEKERSHDYAQRLRESGGRRAHFQEDEDSRWKILARIRIRGQARGYLAVARHQLGRFTRTEAYHLGAVVRLLERALADEEAYQLLQRLHLAFLDGRILLRHLSREEVYRAYLLKALEVCHACSPDQVPDARGRPPTSPWEEPVVRVTVKVLTNNKRSLRHAAFVSTTQEECGLDLRHHPYDLPERGAHPESIAAEAVVRRRTVVTNNYLFYPNKKRLFDDSECHISAPILAGRTSCRGVLSVETARVGAYRLPHTAALTLLAAHLCGPLGLAGEQDALPGPSELLGEAFRRLRTVTTREDLVEVLGDTLVKCGYDRVLVSEYREPAREVYGLRRWPAAGDGPLPRWHVERHGRVPECLAAVTRHERVVRHPPRGGRRGPGGAGRSPSSPSWTTTGGRPGWSAPPGATGRRSARWTGGSSATSAARS
jgi:hypothetical protein